jgi:hypothetical protein
LCRKRPSDRHKPDGSIRPTAVSVGGTEIAERQGAAGRISDAGAMQDKPSDTGIRMALMLVQFGQLRGVDTMAKA